MSFKGSSYRLKAPPDMDFHTFFHVVDNTTRNCLSRQLPTAPANLYLYSSKDQIITVYELTFCNGGTTHALNQFIEENLHDYHTIAAEAWCARNEYLPEYQYGDTFKLPIGKKKETLIVDGQTNDGKLRRSILYDIIRARVGDDSSQVLRFEKITDSEDGSVFLRNMELGGEIR